MSLLQTEIDIFGYIQANWTDVPVIYPNTTKLRPTGAYIQFNIAVVSGTQPATGTMEQRPERSSGDLVGALVMPTGKTTFNEKTGSQLGEDFKKLLSPKRLGQTITFVGRVVDAGLDEAYDRYHYNIIIPYQTNTAIQN